MRQAWRDRAVDLALAYADFQWRAEEGNVFHGRDAEGVLVNTPDAGYTSEVFGPGWWRIGEMNRGVPYSWGGATPLPAFANGIEEGKYAGNVPDSRDNGGSRHCVGVDCSGLVTACWGFEKKLSTRTIPLVSDPLSSLDLLLPGDVILTAGHVLLFVEFLDPAKTEAKIVESSRRAGRVRARRVEMPELDPNDYVGYRRKPEN